MDPQEVGWGLTELPLGDCGGERGAGVQRATRYGYGSGGDYNRNYGGTRSGPQVTLTLP